MSLTSTLLILLIFEVFGGADLKSICREDDLGEVIFVNLLFRHGARTPTSTYPTDPHKEKWTEGLGELTNVGKRQHYELGQWLRKRYDSLLTDKYSPDIIYVQSTDKDRVIMSAQCNLAGMYPPKDGQIWNKELNWQPIPVHTVPSKLDKVLAVHAPCPAYENELKKVLESEEVEELNIQYENIYKILNENTGEDRKDYKYIHNIYDALFVEKQNNLTLPEWTKSIFPHPMQEAAGKIRFALPTWTKKLARLKSGLLIEEMIRNMKKKIEKKKKQNVHIYAAHDTTIANLLNSLGVFDYVIPPYAACVMLELRVLSNGEHYVTLFYRTSPTEEPRLLTLPGCTARCSLDQFISLTESIVPEDWDKECQDDD